MILYRTNGWMSVRISVMKVLKCLGYRVTSCNFLKFALPVQLHKSDTVGDD